MTLTIFEIGTDQYWSGAQQEIGVLDGAPPSWTRSQVPALHKGEFARWNGSEWELTAQAPAPMPIAVPLEVSRRRGLQALFKMYALKEADILATIEAHPTLSDDDKYLARVEFQTSQTFERYRPLVMLMGEALALDLDALFVYAENLS